MTIYEFPLAWRWTQPSHAVLPAEVLAQIHPLSAAEAALIDRRASRQRAPVVSCSTVKSELVTAWLRSVQPDLNARIYAAWSDQLAVATRWEVFTEYWDEFCYPSSDDVVVTPVSGTWHLVYHHFEQFDFSAGS
jgi:hypothetical protein